MYSDQPKIQTLLTLGEPRNYNEWPDYLGKYGFTTEDVPALLELYADEAIDALPEDRSEVWAPLHAWRILGQLGSEAAIATLVQSFDRLCHDDYALSELAKVIGMIGPAAIPALTDHWQQSNDDQFSHIMAVDALSEIAIRHPATTREQILDIYRHYLTRPNTEARLLNGLLIGCLLNLEATEVIDEIRQLFALGCVDITCTGDLEEVEIALGFRTHRATPKPNYAQLHGFDIPGAELANKLGDGTDLDDQDNFSDEAVGYDEENTFEVIEHSLLHYGSDESILGISELDGFFAALACAPVTIMPSTWMPVIWGGEQLMPDWQSEAEIRQFSNALIHHYNIVMQNFLEHEYEPLFLESRIIDPEVVIVDDWCEGFLRGFALWEALAPAEMLLVETCLQPIRYFCTDEGSAALLSMSDSEVQQIQDSIQPSVSMLHAHFFKRVKHANTTFVHTAPKPGRNDPCPCGSGKKHKKCCGLH